MEATPSNNIFTSISTDLLAAEILPWLSYGQLTKVARVSKQFSKIVNTVGPFTIDTFHEGWLDRQRVQSHIERCRNLTLNKGDLNLLEHLARIKEPKLERLDVQNLSGDNDVIAQLIATIIKNNKKNCLKVLGVPVINFKNIVAEEAICPSLQSLSISNHRAQELEIEMSDVLKVFPALESILLFESPKIDLYKHLTKRADSPIEFVHLSNYDVSSPDSIIANLKGFDFYMVLYEDKKDALQHLKKLKYLKVEFGWAQEVFNLPKLKRLESLDLLCGDQTSYCKSIECAKNLTQLTASQKFLQTLNLPQSLKSVSSRIVEPTFNPAILVKLPNLESVTLTFDGSAFWTADKGGLAKTMKRIHLEGFKITSWSSKMNVFANLTHFTLKEAEIKKIPSEFFVSCPKLVQFELHSCRKLSSLSTKLSVLSDLEVFRVRSCALKSIPKGLKHLQRLQLIDLRNNPFDKDCEIPLTLPVRTIVFKDREWIQVIQSYIKEQTKAPTVRKMFKLPFLPSYKRLEEGRLARVLLHGLGVKGAELEPNDDNSDYLAGALMRDYDDTTSLEDTPERLLASDPPPYHAKHVTVGIILFHEYTARHGVRLKLVRVKPGKSRVQTYSLAVSDEDTGSRGWSSRSVWKLDGCIHEFKDLNGTEKERKYIRSVVEPR